MSEPDEDARWFFQHPERQTHLRAPGKVPHKDKQRAVRYLDESELQFRSLPPHDPKLRRIILYRVPPENPSYDPNRPQILKIPFVLLHENELTDEDPPLLKVIHELMTQASGQ